MTADEVARYVEAHIEECRKTGQTLPRWMQTWMRGWPDEFAAGEPHPWYGDCDGLGTDGNCSECERIGGRTP